MSDPLTPDDLERMRAYALLLLRGNGQDRQGVEDELAEMAVRLLDEVERLRERLTATERQWGADLRDFVTGKSKGHG